MNNKLKAKVVGFHPHIEEEVVLLINDKRITCFATYCPYELEEGKEYPIEFSFHFINDDILLEESDSEIRKIERIDSAYTHLIYGKLNGDTLDAGIKFIDEDLFLDCWELDGKYVKLKVGRLDVSFLEE